MQQLNKMMVKFFFNIKNILFIYLSIDRTVINEDTNLNGEDGSVSNKITINIKQIHNHTDIESLPPNKRRLRERHAAILNSSDTSTNNNSLSSSASSSSSLSTEENFPIEPTPRNIPINSIKKFLQIRQQVCFIFFLNIKKFLISTLDFYIS